MWLDVPYSKTTKKRERVKFRPTTLLEKNICSAVMKYMFNPHLIKMTEESTLHWKQSTWSWGDESLRGLIQLDAAVPLVGSFNFFISICRLIYTLNPSCLSFSFSVTVLYGRLTKLPTSNSSSQLDLLSLGKFIRMFLQRSSTCKSFEGTRRSLTSALVNSHVKRICFKQLFLMTTDFGGVGAIILDLCDRLLSDEFFKATQ